MEKDKIRYNCSFFAIFLLYKITYYSFKQIRPRPGRLGNHHCASLKSDEKGRLGWEDGCHCLKSRSQNVLGQYDSIDKKELTNNKWERQGEMVSDQ